MLMENFLKVWLFKNILGFDSALSHGDGKEDLIWGAISRAELVEKCALTRGGVNHQICKLAKECWLCVVPDKMCNIITKA